MRENNLSHELTVVGSAALDTIETPSGRVEDALGGSAFYIGAAASMFTPLHLIAVVGEDFPMAEIAFLRARGVNLDGLEVASGATFRWEGRYHENMNHRDTICTKLGVFEGFKPKLPRKAAEAGFLLLANIDPKVQLEVLRKMKSTRLTAFDTMNLWINERRSLVDQLIRKVDVVIVNDEELSLLTGTNSMLNGGLELLRRGPRYVVVKKGEHGAILLGRDQPPFLCPAYPLSAPKDPTGAGDTFAGAMIGYLAATGELSPFNFRRAVVYGTVTASFAVEEFGLGRLKSVTFEEIEERFRTFQAMVEF